MFRLPNAFKETTHTHRKYNTKEEKEENKIKKKNQKNVKIYRFS